MYIVKVIPFVGAINKESLTYFSAKNISLGTIVSVPIRKKLVNGLVISVEDLLSSKSAIKSSAFNLKKIEAIKGAQFFSSDFFETCSETSNYFVNQTGSIVNALLPNVFLDNYSKLKSPSSKENIILKDKDILIQEKLVLQTSLDNRLDYYKSLVRESFAQKKSIFLCLPTISEIQTFTTILKKGIEQYIFVLHGRMSDKKQIETYNQIVSEKHPVLVIATGSYLFIPRHDFRTLIIERENSGAYKTIRQPYLDIRTFAEALSAKSKMRLILGDTFLRTETIQRYKEHELLEVSPLSFRILPNIKKEIIDIKKEILKTPKIKKFSVLNDKTEEIILKAIEKQERVFLFSLRKGLAPITACQDCNQTLICIKCDSPLVLYKTNKERLFICNKCKNKEDSKIACRNCKSWNLTTLGIGTDLVVEETYRIVKKKFPKTKIFQIDKETIKTNKQGLQIINEFYKNPGSILVGTEMALFYLKEKVNCTIVTSFDSLFSVPSFRINERIIHLINTLGSYTKEKLIIQTRNSKDKTLKSILTGNLTKFYDEELIDRKKFNYPPYKTLIKLTQAGKKTDINWIMNEMKENFGEYKPEIYRAFISRIKNLYRTNVIFRINKDKWSLSTIQLNGSIDKTLLQKLMLLPPYWTIQVDPEDLL